MFLLRDKTWVGILRGQWWVEVEWPKREALPLMVPEARLRMPLVWR